MIGLQVPSPGLSYLSVVIIIVGPINKDYGSSYEFNITSIMAHCLACVYQIDQPSYLFKAPFPVAICLEVQQNVTKNKNIVRFGTCNPIPGGKFRLDNWEITTLNQTQQENLFQILDDRIQKRSTIATRQLPVEHWHQCMANPTIADAILDRLVQPAYRIELSGDSMRKSVTESRS